MNKALIFKISFLFLFIASGYFSAKGQDSTKAVKPAPVVKHTKTIGTFPPRQAPATTAGTATTPGKSVKHPHPYGAFPPRQAPATTAQGTQPGTTPAVTTPQHITPQPVANNDKSINGQYQYLLSRLYRYQQPVLAAFYKVVQDSMNIQRRKLKESQARVTELSKSLKDVQSDVSTKEASLSQSAQKEDTINMFGANIAKSTYNYIMWGLVIVFGAVATIVILRSGGHSREAKYRTKLYEELDEEYKNYKLKANEKEKKLARELQTARNKLEEITGKPEY